MRRSPPSRSIPGCRAAASSWQRRSSTSSSIRAIASVSTLVHRRADFSDVLLARGARRVYAVDVGRDQLHPKLRQRPQIISIEQTDIRELKNDQWPELPDFVCIDVSFISLKLVLPAALAPARLPARLLALVKPQFEAGRGAAKKEIVRDPDVQSRFVPTLPLSCDPSGGRSWARCPHPSRAATAIASSSSELIVSERLAIARVGRWGDGISDTPGGPVYVPYALPGETVEVEQWPGHPDRRRLLEVETASPERIAPICPHFGVAGDARSSTGRGRATGNGSARSSSRRWHKSGSKARWMI